MNEIHEYSGMIRHSLHRQKSEMLNRLRNTEGTMECIIYKEIALLQNYIENTDNIINRYFTNRDDPTDLLLCAKELTDAAKQNLATPFETNIIPSPTQLPRELATQRATLQKTESLKQLLNFKNEQIWKILVYIREEECRVISEFNSCSSGKVKALSDMVEKYSADHQAFKMVCYYCGCRLTQRTINQPCKSNTTKKEDNEVTKKQKKDEDEEEEAEEAEEKQDKGYTKPPPEDYSLDWHYFSSPLKLPPQSSNPNADLNIQKNGALILLKAREFNIDLKEILSSHDYTRTGRISSAALKYILSEELGLPKSLVVSVSTMFSETIDGREIIIYPDFLSFLSDPAQTNPSQDNLTVP